MLVTVVGTRAANIGSVQRRRCGLQCGGARCFFASSPYTTDGESPSVTGSVASDPIADERCIKPRAPLYRFNSIQSNQFTGVACMGGRASVAAALTATAAAASASASAIPQIRKVSTSTAAAAAAAFVPTSARRPPAPYPTTAQPFLFPVRGMTTTSTAADDGGAGDIKARKAALRKEVAGRLRALDDAYIREQVRCGSVWCRAGSGGLDRLGGSAGRPADRQWLLVLITDADRSFICWINPNRAARSSRGCWRSPPWRPASA